MWTGDKLLVFKHISDFYSTVCVKRNAHLITNFLMAPPGIGGGKSSHVKYNVCSVLTEKEYYTPFIDIYLICCE